ncbi:MAG: restriction endonuclease [Candidatus Thermoplasmatota archaeon]|nr:restriction endonuclease [Candidatus Thermoplasmatota archaeon]MCG2825449.1 hypothetical protein [Thermoplasmatales archaeon]
MRQENIVEQIKAEIKKINKDIEILGRRVHTKASEVYIDAIFKYPKQKEEWHGAVPIEYRRTGTSAKTKEEIIEVLKDAYDAMNPEKKDEWLKEQEKFWQQHKRARVTGDIFKALTDSKWKCVTCQLTPLSQTTNPQARIKDIKYKGYTLATDTNRECKTCDKKTTHHILLRLPRGGETRYETWSPKLRKRILKVLRSYDAYENATQAKHLLPDHKFPETRWDADTKEENPDDMPDEEIRKKFQLLDNQRNQQKREVCRRCFQTGCRGFPFGIKFFYEGGEKWPDKAPRHGKKAEKGCVGCGWYDLAEWRKQLNKFIEENRS